MTKFLLNLLISGIAVLIASYLTPGVAVESLWVAILVALALSLVNATLGALLRMITFPINFITFGLV